VKGHTEACRHQTHDKETREAYLIQVFRVEEEVGDAEILPEISRDHREQNDPAKHEHNVSPDVV